MLPVSRAEHILAAAQCLHIAREALTPVLEPDGGEPPTSAHLLGVAAVQVAMAQVHATLAGVAFDELVAAELVSEP